VKEVTVYAAATVAQVPELVPPYCPLQVHEYEPVMPVIVPVEQAWVPLGSVEAYLPFLVPQLPLIGVLFLEAVQL